MLFFIIKTIYFYFNLISSFDQKCSFYSLLFPIFLLSIGEFLLCIEVFFFVYCFYFSLFLIILREERLERTKIPQHSSKFKNIYTIFFFFCFSCSSEKLFKIMKHLWSLKSSKWKCNFIVYYQKTPPGHPKYRTGKGHGDSFGKFYFLLSFLLFFQVHFYTQVKLGFFFQDMLFK